MGVTAGGEEEGGGKQDTTGTIGVEYRRKITRLIGVGLLVEYAGAVRRDHAGIIPLTFRPGRHAQVIVGVGWERLTGNELSGNESQALVRVGFGYSIELLPRNSIRPEINFDFVDGEELLIVGASIGWGF